MKKTPRSGRTRKRAFCTSHGILFAAATAALATYYPARSLAGLDQWDGGNGDWNTASHWGLNAVPGPGDTANVTSLNGVTQSIPYDYPGPAVTLGTLNLSLVNGTSPSSEILTISAGRTLSSNQENIGGFPGSPSGTLGNGGSGTFTQSAGSNVIAVGGLYMGYNAADQGFYNLSGTGSLQVANEFVGESGTGNFNQTGGTNFCLTLTLGDLSGSTGSYTLTSTGTLTAGQLEVGNNGTGFFTQSSGSNSVTSTVFNENGSLLIGNRGSTGTYTLSGTGTLTADQETIGNSATGIFNQMGGTNTITNITSFNTTQPNAFIVGYEATGTYTQSAGGLSTVGDEIIGYSATGNFNQSGGTNMIGGTLGLVVGYSAPGAYTLSSVGTLTATGVTVGYGDSGNFMQSGGTNTVGSLGLVVGVFSPGTYTLSGNSTLTASQENIGGMTGSIGALGNFTQTAGSNVINTGGLYLGFNSRDQGSYALNGGSLSVKSGGEYIGYSGTGTFTQTAGSNSLSPQGNNSNIFLGNNTGSTGTYTLSGTGSISVFEEEIGVSGTGIFTQSGGQNNLLSNFSLDLGVNAGSSGTYNLSGSGAIFPSFFEYIGDQGNGIFNQSGGNNDVSFGGGILIVANAAKSTGTYTLSSVGTLTAETENIGVAGTAFFTQTGGTNSANSNLNLGSNVGSSGTYTLSGTGTLTAGQETIGFSGTGNFSQSGGTNTISVGNSLSIASNSNSTGTFVLSGGTTSVSDVNVGGSQFGELGGKGVLTVSGSGILNVSDQLQVFPTKGAVINLSGGTINTDILNINGNPSVFNWTSGTLGLTRSVTFDPSAANNSTGGAFGASLTIGPNQTLVVTGGETLGGGALFTLTNSGGTNNIIGSGNALVLGNNSVSTGTYNLSNSGSLSAGAETIGSQGSGFFTQSGGTNNIIGSGNALVLGNNSVSTGTYNLSNSGSLSAGTETIGSQGSGFFTQSGGTNTDSGDLMIAASTNATGTFVLSNGTALVSGSAYVGGSSSGAGGGGVLTVSNSGQLTVTGMLSVYANGTVNINGGATTVGGLSISTGGVVNMNGALLIKYPSGNDPATIIRGYLQTGYNGDTWNGKGIDSGTAAANPGLLAVGYADGNADVGTPAGANQIYIQKTLAGDANLDGIVNFPDLLVVAQDFGKTGEDWAHGDFNYDGIVNFPDLLLVAQNFGKQLSAGQLAELPGSFAAQWELAEAEVQAAGASSDVPEPGRVGLMVFGASGLLVRRRRRGRIFLARQNTPTQPSP